MTLVVFVVFFLLCIISTITTSDIAYDAIAESNAIGNNALYEPLLYIPPSLVCNETSIVRIHPIVIESTYVDVLDSLPFLHRILVNITVASGTIRPTNLGIHKYTYS